MSLSNRLLLLIAAALLSLFGSPSAPSYADTDMPAPMVIADDMSCGVCGMFPARYPKWQTQIIFKDGFMVPFDGSKDMFKYILDMGKYAADRSSNDIAAVWVRGFNTGEWLDGKKAVYVMGSKEMGPMGKELAPFASTEAAQSFKEENGGMLIHFSEVSMSEIKGLGMGGMKMKEMKMEGMKMDGMKMESKM